MKDAAAYAAEAQRFFNMALRAEAEGGHAKVEMALYQACKAELHSLGFTSQANSLQKWWTTVAA